MVVEMWGGLGVKKERGIDWFLDMMNSFKNVLQAVGRTPRQMLLI